MTKPNILLIGTGAMAAEHAKTLILGLGAQVTVAARDKEKLKKFHDEYNTYGWYALPEITKSQFAKFDGAIIASSIESLETITSQLIDMSLLKILVEKPATLDSKSSLQLHEKALKAGCKVRVAYNRRYYSSVLKLKQILQEEPPIAGFFDFTEWPDRVLSVPMATEAKARLAIANSGHVIDTFEFLLGSMRSLNVSITGEQQLDWHPAGATFVGSGYSGKTPVSYCTSWLSAGRWNIEILTKIGKYKLSPMEQLQFLPLKSLNWEQVPLSEEGNKFKPGLFKMLEAFFLKDEKESQLPNLMENSKLLGTIEHIAGYRNN